MVTNCLFSNMAIVWRSFHGSESLFVRNLLLSCAGPPPKSARSSRWGPGPPESSGHPQASTPLPGPPPLKPTPSAASPANPSRFDASPPSERRRQPSGFQDQPRGGFHDQPRGGFYDQTPSEPPLKPREEPARSGCSALPPYTDRQIASHVLVLEPFGIVGPQVERPPDKRRVQGSNLYSGIPKPT